MGLNSGEFSYWLMCCCGFFLADFADIMSTGGVLFMMEGWPPKRFLA